jgi:hypothetical protein
MMKVLLFPVMRKYIAISNLRMMFYFAITTIITTTIRIISMIKTRIRTRIHVVIITMMRTIIMISPFVNMDVGVID